MKENGYGVWTLRWTNEHRLGYSLFNHLNPLPNHLNPKLILGIQHICITKNNIFNFYKYFFC